LFQARLVQAVQAAQELGLDQAPERELGPVEEKLSMSNTLL
jgi:hypothetical protein